MTPATNQSGFAPPGVVEVELGSLRAGQRFRLWGYGPSDTITGRVLYRSECSVRIQPDGSKRIERNFFGKDGEAKELNYTVALQPENWAPSCPVEYLPDTAASPESEQEVVQ